MLTKNKINSQIIIVTCILTFIWGCKHRDITPQIAPDDGPYPEFLPRTYPERKQRLSIEGFADHSNSYWYIGDTDILNVICFELNPTVSLENNDEGFEFNDYASRIQLLLNGVNIWTGPSLYIEDELQVYGEALQKVEELDDGSFRAIGTQVITKPFNGVGPYRVCSEIDPNILKTENAAEFVLISTSGKLFTYSWSFEIIEE